MFVLYIPLITYCAGFIVVAICSAVMSIAEDEDSEHRSTANQQQGKGNDECRLQATAVGHQRYERKIKIWIDFNQYCDENNTPIFYI